MSKILFLTGSLGFGGAEKMLTFVANQLNIRGNTVGIINLNRVPDYLKKSKQSIDAGIVVYEIENSGSGIKRCVRDLSFVIKIAKKFKPDILIGFTEKPSLYAKLSSVLLGIPSIMCERGDPNRTNGRKGLNNKIVAAIIERSKGAIFQTEGAQAFFSNNLKKRSAIIPNPIFINRVIGERPSIPNKTVVSVGRLDNEQKRYDVMIKAFELFYKTHPDYILKLYGDGIDRQEIEKMIDDLNLTNAIKLMGVSKNPLADIVTDGIFIITSDYEGISNSLLEAMAVGLPCVSTDHTPGGARLLIQDHENGLLAPIGDYEKLAACLAEYADDPQLAIRCGKNAKNVISRFNPQRIIDMWEGYILKIIGN